ncbi:NUDIX domain-containing protein [Streptomyces sp. NPDC049881]|uniref:NUDIX hydrolase n=1 Tax=unclassified Streptomyces TaxID=2593676 RepID=UPI00344303FA
MRTPREAARVAVLDPAGAVFMFRYDNSEVGVHWAMPGGGLDPGETPEAAAARELREETGWTGVPLRGTLCLWEHDYTRAGVPVRQRERIYLAYGPRREPVGDLTAAHAEDGILRWRWWSPAELAVADEALWPPQLPQVLDALRADGPPAVPADFGYVPNSPR